MNKFIITEEEKNRILNLYEKLGDRLAPENLNSMINTLNSSYNQTQPTK